MAVKLFVFHNVAVSKYLKPHPNIRGQISLTGAGIPFQAAIFAAKKLFANHNLKLHLT